jgi:hypothetical protein
MKFPLAKTRSNIKEFAGRLSESGFRQIFNHIDQLGIKNGVDRMGLEKFVNQCAYIAAGSGVVSGTGGVLTMAIGMPIDFVNLITQQFRVTMAILYYHNGNYKIGFDDFMRLVATSMKVEAGVAITKTVLEGVAEKIILRLGVRTAQRLIPVVGAAIGGTTNYLFVKRMAESARQLLVHDEPVVIPIG